MTLVKILTKKNTVRFDYSNKIDLSEYENIGNNIWKKKPSRWKDRAYVKELRHGYYIKYSNTGKVWAQNNKIKIASARHNYYLRNKEKIHIRNYAYNNLRNNIIDERKVCEKCGSIYMLQLHHEEYVDNTRLRLLCKKCHMEEHKKILIA